MSRVTRVWRTTKKFNREAGIEERIYSDGTLHYTFFDTFGRPHTVEKEEINKLIKTFFMEELK